MKIAAIVAVIALCTIHIASGYVSNLETLRNGIARQKTTVQNTVNSLNRHERKFTSDLNSKLSNAKINSMQEINSIVNPTLERIQNAAKQSTAEGKDASSCYESARVRLREYSLTGFDDLDNCRNEALSSTSQTQNNIQSTISVGQQVISHLDSIFPSCFSTNTQKMESCIVGMLPEATQLVKSFQRTADSVMNSSGSALITAQTKAVNCNRGLVSTVWQGATSVQQDANSCIAAL